MFFDDIRAEVATLPTGPQDLRKFAITMTVAFGLFAALTWYTGNGLFPYLLGLALVFFGFGLIKPTLLKSVYLGWMTLAVLLGFFMTRILLSVMFYTVFSLGGVIIKILGKDMLDERYEPEADTYWKPYVKPQDPRTRLERQF